MHRAFLQTLLALLVVYLVLPANARYIASSITRRNALRIGHTTTRTNCGFVGNSDIYGLGIRIGYYVQFITVWFQYHFAARGAITVRSVNRLFMLAMLVALVILSRSPGNNFAVEALLAFQIIYISCLLTPAQFSKSRGKVWDSDIDDIILNTSLYAFVFGYNIWFWWIGLNKLQPTPCGTFALIYFYRFNIYGRMREAQKVLSLAVPVFGMPRILSHIFLSIRARRVRELDSTGYQKSLLSSLRKELSQLASASHSLAITVGQSGNALVSTSKSVVARPLRRWSTSMVQSSDLRNDIGPATLASTSPGTVSRQSSTGHSISKQYNSPLYTFGELHKVDLIFDDIIMRAKEDEKAMGVKEWQILGMKFSVTSPSACVHRIMKFLRVVRQCSYREGLPLGSFYLLLVHCQLEGHFLMWYSWLTLGEAILQETRFSRLSWPAAHLISVIRLTKTTKVEQSRRWRGYAINGLLLIFYQIASLELTIRWNSISGLHNIGTVGQLVPLMIGLGGLANTLYWECKARWFNDTKEDEGRLSYEDLADAYYECKQLREKLYGTSPSAPVPP